MNTKVFTIRSISAALGIIYFAANLCAQTDVPDDDDVIQQSIKFAQVYAALEKNYMDGVNPDQVILEGSIRGMLSTLDPFSSFFNPDQFQMLQEQTRGNTLGFGSILYVSPGKVVVLQAAPNSPSGRAGLGPGDEIVSVNGQRIARLGFDSLIELLEHARSQPVSLGVIHPGKLVPEDFKLVPAEVALPSVDKAFTLKPGIAYLHISGFEQKTPQEISDGIIRLGGASLKGVLLDLRDNHGGMVDSAVATASLFLKPDLLMLTVRGRAAREQTYNTIAVPAHFDMPVIVLVNQNTASAAEILAAALEEHDRAVLVGEPTFGKGVVEGVGPLSNKCGLALTTAQYFTPSGRSIQRPLPGTALAEQTDLGQARGIPVSKESKPDYRTDAGRPVMAGGGITPDIAVPEYDLDPWVTFLNQRGLITSFASAYLTLHGKVEQSFEPDESALNDFKEFLGRQGILAPEEFWGPDQEYLKLHIKTEVFNLVFGLAAGDEVEVKGDPQVQKAATYFDILPKMLKTPIAKASAAPSGPAHQ
ncbi:MAG TPA: S41 family peptidase [Terriglobia bacterium]|nr:S41 family peptidase [Terriglobia bacterium]